MLRGILLVRGGEQHAGNAETSGQEAEEAGRRLVIEEVGEPEQLGANTFDDALDRIGCAFVDQGPAKQVGNGAVIGGAAGRVRLS